MSSKSFFGKVFRETSPIMALRRKFWEKPRAKVRQQERELAGQVRAREEQGILLEEEKRKRRQLLLQPSLETNLSQATGRKQFLGQ